jgi:uncharacterized repeat protein (TIGR02543 family)
MSADGTKLVGGKYNGAIWTSSDSGATWLSRSGAGNRGWTGVAVSQSSNVIYGVVPFEGVWRSSDFGATWSKTDAPTNCNYVGVATSGTTNVSVACGNGNNNGGGIYVNTNEGVGNSGTWTLSSGTSGRNFTEIKSSFDGTKLFASVWNDNATPNGGVYMASNGTFSYTNLMSAPLTNYLWSSLGVNSDGTKLIATSRGAGQYGSGGNVYTSVDTGSTWIASSGPNAANGADSHGDWMNAAISADGSALMAVAFGGGRITISRNGGTTWVSQSPSGAFLEAVMCPSGGRYLAAHYYGGRIQLAESNAATLSGLAVSFGTLSPTFNSCNTSYTATVANSVSSGFTITPTKSQSNATTVQYLGATGTTAFAGNLSVGANVIRTVVTSQDGTAKATYTVTVTRAAGVGSDASLSGLALSSGTLSPTFSTGTTSYTATVANSVSSGFTVTATKSQSNATTVQYLGATGTTAFTGNLSVGANVIRTVVTAQDGTIQTYTVTVTRAASADATLSGLSISSGTLSPTFASGTTSYTASVSNSVSSGFTVTATKSQSDATTVQYLGSSGTTTFAGNLSVGANVIRTVVTAPDGATQQTYTVTVTRAASAVATLSGLSISSGTLSPTFASGTTSYTATVANSVSSGFTVTATKSQSDATAVQYLGSTGTTAFSGNLSVGANVIRTVVTAQDAVTTSTYTVTVTREASAVATLSGLSISSGTLSPTFSTGTTSYTATVANSVSSGFTVTATKSQSDATTTQYLGSSGTTTFTGNLSVGANVIRTVITSQDGAVTSTYTVTVTRASSDASLINLTLSSGTLAPTFATGTSSYTATVANSVSTGFTVTATKNQSDATTTQYLGSSGTTTFAGNLSVGANVIRTVVTAQDGTIQTYTVTVTRAEQSHTITWDDQGATTASSGGSTSYTNASAIAIIPATAPQKTGHTFVGWFTSASSGRQLTNGSFTPASPYGNLTFYAHWTVNKSSAIGTWAWTNQSAAGTRNWHALTTSADGSKLFAGVDGGGSLYRSTDFGVTWNSIADTSGRNWFSIASNLDGTKVAAVDRGGDIWTSTDSGSTWTRRVVGGAVRNWESIASSSDGVKLVAVASNGDNNGFIFTSTDSGVTWSINRAPSGTNKFTGVTSSNDGTYLAATTWASGIFTSSDSGLTWILRTLPVPNSGSATHLQAVASSGDGSRLVTGSRLSGASNGGIIFTSADYGASWKAYSQTNLDYINFTSNGDGSRLAAAIYGQAGVSTSADFGATWSFQTVGVNGEIPIASNIDGSLLFVGAYGGNLWTGKIPNARVVAVLPSSTSANLSAVASTPATSISFSASNAAAAMTVTPISNPTTEALTPFNVSQASVFDISVVNVNGQVTICVDGGSNVRLWHYTNGAWADVTTSQTATQTCGLTNSFSPFATATAVVPPVVVTPPVTTPPVPVVVYVPPSPVPYLKTMSTPEIRLSGAKLTCTAGTYTIGYTLDGVIQAGTTALYTPASFTFHLMFNQVAQSLFSITTGNNSATWDLGAPPAGTLISCSVTVSANSLKNTDNSTANTALVSAAVSTQTQSISAAESAYFAEVSAISKSYQKRLSDNRATWRADVEKVRAAYFAERNQINGLPASKEITSLKSAALKTYIAAQKRVVAEYKASGPAARAVRDLANQAALDGKNSAVAKANAIYGSFIESIGYAVLIP